MSFQFQRKSQSERERILLEKSEQFLACGIRSTTIRPGYNMIMKSGKGAHITDTSDNEYIDYLLGSGPMFLGHSHPAMVEAVRGRVDQGTSFLLTNDVAIELAEEIARVVPCAEQVTFHNSGSEATYYALRMARAYRGRDKMLKFEGAYHGMHDHALMSAQFTMEPADFPQAVSNSAGIPQQTSGDVLIAPFNDIERTVELIRKHADELACVMVEPMCRTFTPLPGFLEGLREVTRELDIPLIFDEVVTGFRLALGGAQEYYGVVPDLCAGAKAVTGGLPFGFVGGRRDIMELAGAKGYEQGNHVRLTGTYSGNVISTSVALALIKELQTPGLYEEVNRKGLRLKNALVEMLDHADIPATVIGEPTAFQPMFTSQEVIDHRSYLTIDWAKNFRLIELLMDRGIVKGQEKFFISTAHTDDDIDYTIDVLKDSMEELKKATF
ncbi:aspartate aminotransferase family protein [Endozoicomonas sp. OPT23]|uniref:aspartate aminotransferase family protein n=1 Tax=Endozoicomonas sp. OPT23 TaxID=2072845 RepID=UPI00129ACB88|nr:aminotransferase class III-fold pyridoxal phosphate-dependent enzyme [Endozoicomonas sp. OPT23]MRI32814.1 aspartate aminotransferase family protein [Endozoicomonas sp. OPT23]